MITQTFDLNLIPEQAPVVVHCDQYDKGTGRLIIKLYEGDVAYSPTGTAIIQGCKPDGHGFSYSVTLSGNTVTADLTEQMSCVSGRVRCQIVVTESTGRTGTFVFILEVQPSALPSDADMSESEYEFIEQAIELTQQAAEDAQESAEDAEAWAVGERGGVPVGPTDPTYHNNAEYYAQQASQIGSLDDLNDVTITTPTNDQVLTYDSNAGKWVNANAQSSVSDLDDLNDVTITTPVDQQVLTYDSNSGEWINANAQGGVTQLDQLSDVTISAPTDGQSLVYDSNAGEWVNGSGGGSSTLAGLTDVTITSATDGQALLYDANSGDWVNGTVSGGGGMNTDGSNAASNVGFSGTEVFTVGDRTGKASTGAQAFELGDGATASGYGAYAEGAKCFNTSINSVSVPANTLSETLIQTTSLSSYPYQCYSLTGPVHVLSNIEVYIDGGLDQDETITNGNVTVRFTQDGTNIKAYGINTDASAQPLYYGYTESQNVASGDFSHVEGAGNTASVRFAHAEGKRTQATGESAHAEGTMTTASGGHSHAEGVDTYATGGYSHAEGSGTRASSYGAHAEGLGTKASSSYQHVSGKYNVEDNSDTYALIVGNGTGDGSRSNALTLEWTGKLQVAGDVKSRNGYSLENIGQGLASINATGATNTTGSTITAGTYFYYLGILVRAKTNIANGATFTLNTNYEVVTAGALNELRTIYSTSEVFTGDYWIDGKPIYRKTYSGIVCTTGEYNYITSEYIDTPINITGYLEFSGGTKYTIGAVTVSATQYSATVFLRQPTTGPATINCQKGSLAENYTATVTIYYTKQ